MTQVRKTRRATFERKVRDGEWEQVMDVDRFGKCEVRDTHTNRTFWVRVD